MLLLELFQTKDMHKAIYDGLQSIIEPWRENFKLKLKDAKLKLKKRQTISLKRNFGKERKSDYLKKMYDEYNETKKEYENIFFYNFGHRVQEALASVLKPYLFFPLDVHVFFNDNDDFTASMSIIRSRLSLSLYLKSKEKAVVNEILYGADPHKLLIDIATIIVHEMVHYNQYQHEIMTRGGESEKLLNRDKYSKKYFDNKNDGKIKIIAGKDINYWSSDIEIEAYAADTAHDLVDEAKIYNKSIKDCIKTSKNYALRIYREIGKTRPKVLKTFLSKLILNLNHLGVSFKESITEAALLKPTIAGAEMYYEEMHNVMAQMVYEYKSGKHIQQPWKVVPSAKLIKIWKDAAKNNGQVFDTKGIEMISQRMVENTIRLEINTILAGHTETVPDDFLEDFEMDDIKSFDMQKFHDWVIEYEGGQARISDYGLEPLKSGAMLLLETDDPNKKLTIIDWMLNVTHQRSDLASWFVQGGRATLSQLHDD